ncbi:MAG: hypothetical protein IJ901_05860 [Bacteroidaceae bacterium]|nr:hypothetical protein [Bacteroidaceae bacterium]
MIIHGLNFRELFTALRASKKQEKTRKTKENLLSNKHEKIIFFFFFVFSCFSKAAAGVKETNEA